ERFVQILGLIRERARQRSASKPSSRETRQWTDNAKRDQIILEGLQDDRPRREICQRLDRCLIDATSGMRRAGHSTWTGAWDDKNSRRLLQSLFSKLKRRKAVKH